MGDKDRRVEFIQEYTLKSMRLKADKWNKIIIFDEQRQYLQVWWWIWKYSCSGNYPRPSWTATSHNRWWSRRTSRATSTSTRTGPAPSGTRASTLLRGRRGRFPRTRWSWLIQGIHNCDLPRTMTFVSSWPSVTSTPMLWTTSAAGWRRYQDLLESF